MRTALFLSLALCASPAFPAKFDMHLTARPEQAARMSSGVGAVDSSASKSSVRLVQAEGDLKKRGSVQVMVMNQGGASFNFGPENVSARLADGTPIAIIQYDQLVKEEKRRQAWRAVAAGLAAAGNSMSAANAGYYSGTGTYSGSTNGSFGMTPFSSYSSGTVTLSGYDAGRAQMAQSVANAQNQANFARMAERNAANLASLKTYMRTTTVDPEQVFGGTVLFELPKTVHKMTGDVPVVITVLAGGEEHQFDAILRRK